MWGGMGGQLTPDPSHEMVGIHGALHIAVPRGSAFVVLHGSVAPDGGMLSVEWDPPCESCNRNLNVSSWERVSVPLYMRRLDPAVSYTLSLRPDGPVGLRSILFYPPPAMPRASMYVSAELGCADGSLEVQPAGNSTEDTSNTDQEAAKEVARIVGAAVSPARGQGEVSSQTELIPGRRHRRARACRCSARLLETTTARRRGALRALPQHAVVLPPTPAGHLALSR